MHGLIKMLQNTKLGTFHPIMYVEKYLPGDGSDNLIRFKSKGHHTSGFKTREEAMATIPDLKKRMLQSLVLTVTEELDEKDDLLWDGEDIPADVQVRLRDEDAIKKDIEEQLD